MKPRIVLAGGPRTGKTTLADELAVKLGLARAWCTDDLIGTHDWSAASAEIATWFDREGPWVVEGTASVRALRKWMKAHPDGAPADAVVLLWDPREALTPGQATMAKGCLTVWTSIAPELRARGVRVCNYAREGESGLAELLRRSA